MSFFAPRAAALAFAAGTTVAIAAQASPLDVRLAVTQPVLRGDVDVVVEVTVTNPSRHPVHVLRWQLPSEDWEQPLFRVVRDDRTPVKYLGAVVKRTAPSMQDHIKLEGGAVLRYRVELSGAYDLSQNGRYTVQYVSRSKQGATLASAPLYLWLEGRSGLQAQAAAQPAPAAGGSISFTGNCSSSQQALLRDAVSAATGYANESLAYLSRTPAATARYTKWFGDVTTARWNTARAHFSASADAFANKPLTLDCKCKKKNVYAYVYPTQPYKIYLCGAFWSAPLTGTDSKAGTLVHEMSHFNVVAGTDDWAYGQAAAAELAASDPDKALNNADNHEYFAENTPALP